MDQDLVVRAQHGDRQAFDTLVVNNHSRLYRVASGILRDRHLAEDATQQAFLDIWRDIPRLKDPSKFDAWSYRLLVNACYDEVKRKPKWLTDAVIESDLEPRTRDASDAVIARDQLERALQRLSMDHRVVLVMRYMLDLDPEEIGDTLGIPRRTVYSRMKRAMNSVRGVLEADARDALGMPVGQEVVR